MIGFLIALVSGALMSIQGVFNTQVTKSSGIWTASAFVQFYIFDSFIYIVKKSR